MWTEFSVLLGKCQSMIAGLDDKNGLGRKLQKWLYHFQNLILEARKYIVECLVVSCFKFEFSS